MIHGLLGGVLIGLAAVLLLWSIGRIAGISGIAGGALEGTCGDHTGTARQQGSHNHSRCP